MANCLFAYPDRTLTATISTTGTAWDASFPLNNLKNRLKSKVARSTGVTTAHTKFDVTLATTSPVRMIALINHNASYGLANAATVTLSFSNTALGNYELGHIVAAPIFATAFYPTLPAGWDTSITAADYQASPDFWYVLPASINCKYIRVEISDPDNTAGYFQLGRCFIASAWQPSVNIDYGNAVAWRQVVNKDTSLGGVDWFNVLSRGREIACEFTAPIAEGMFLAFDAQRRLGLEGELYFIFDPDDTCQLYKQRAMLCRHADINPLENPYFGHASNAFKLVEVI